MATSSLREWAACPEKAIAERSGVTRGRNSVSKLVTTTLHLWALPHAVYSGSHERDSMIYDYWANFMCVCKRWERSHKGTSKKTGVKRGRPPVQKLTRTCDVTVTAVSFTLLNVMWSGDMRWGWCAAQISRWLAAVKRQPNEPKSTQSAKIHSKSPSVSAHWVPKKTDSYENSNISLALPATLSQIRFTSINLKCLASVFDTQETRMGIIHKASS